LGNGFERHVASVGRLARSIDDRSTANGKEGHWVLIKGVKLCDTYSEGRWQFVCDGPHKGARIMEVFAVRRALGV